MGDTLRKQARRALRDAVVGWLDCRGHQAQAGSLGPERVKALLAAADRACPFPREGYAAVVWQEELDRLRGLLTAPTHGEARELPFDKPGGQSAPSEGRRPALRLLARPAGIGEEA